MAEAPRLLVSAAASDHLKAELERGLPTVPVEFASGSAAGPWPEAAAMLVAHTRRELPAWTYSLTPKVRFVQRIFTGLDGFPFDDFPRDVQVAANGGGYAPFVAEHVVALLLAVHHNLPENVAQVRVGRLRPAMPNRYVRDSVALVLGFGSIGREVARRLRALGLRVEGVSRSGSPDPDAEAMHASRDLRAAVSRADVVIECRPLTTETRGTLDAAVLAAMRPEATLVNVGRAGTVDEGALYEHLRSQPAFHAAIDVWWEENYVAGVLHTRFPFADLPNFLGTPHVAGIGPAARDYAETKAVENLVRFFDGQPPRYVADRAEYG
jgi:phosphoglycerate dehydrogenase-like enzyme